MERKKRMRGSHYDEALPSRLRILLSESTQDDLAKVLGKTRQMISYYADGSSSPSWQTIVLICQHFHVSADWLLGLSETKSTDATARSAQEYTGLREAALSTLASVASDQNDKRPLSLDDYRSIVSDILETNEFYELCRKLYTYERLFLTRLDWESYSIQHSVPEEEFFQAVTDALDNIGLSGLYLSEVCAMYKNEIGRMMYQIVESFEARLATKFNRDGGMNNGQKE